MARINKYQKRAQVLIIAHTGDWMVKHLSGNKQGNNVRLSKPCF